jgi:SAM-dependent methyltransferase
MARTDDEISEVQRRYFERADAERFRWTTSALGFADAEQALIAPLVESLRSPCLEIGCGEGNNLLRLAENVRCIGVDRFSTKLVFAAGVVPDARYAAADAAALPFRNGAFHSVFIRDLLHHVPAPARVLAEAVRVLAPQGRLVLLEPNGKNPIILLQTYLVPAERAGRKSGVASIGALLRDLPLTDIDVGTREPLPLRRLVLHYRFGAPALGRMRWTRNALMATERFLGSLLPRSRWSYVAATATRSAT